MSVYLDGTTVLGAVSQIEAENIALTKKIDMRLARCILLGIAIATPGLAIVWKAHRIVGGLLGLFVVGPVVGFGSGLALSRKDIKKIEENQARQQQEKRALASSASSATPPAGMFSPF